MIEHTSNYSAGDLASIMGVIISMIGFAITLYNVFQSKNSANRAEKAALEAKNSIKLFDTVSNTSKVISLMDEARRLNRSKDWKLLLERYSDIKKILIEIRISNPNLNTEQIASINSVIGHISNMESSIEIALEKSSTPTNVAKTNKVISSQVEKLHVILVEVKSEKGNKNVLP